MLGFQINDMFDEGKYIHESYVDKLADYICGNLHNWMPNRSYWRSQYEQCTNLRIVIRWRKKMRLPAYAKKEEKIRNNELVNGFFQGS